MHGKQNIKKKLEKTRFPGFESDGTAPIPAAGLKRVVRTVCTWSDNLLRANGYWVREM